jgi:hypothetical protein
MPTEVHSYVRTIVVGDKIEYRIQTEIDSSIDLGWKLHSIVPLLTNGRTREVMLVFLKPETE